MLKMFTVYDSKTEAYLQPFYALATGAAIRMFESAASDPSHHFHKHSADYTLFEIGSFDEQSGKFEQLNTHINLGNAITLRRQPHGINPDITGPVDSDQAELLTPIHDEFSHRTADGRAVHTMSKSDPNYEAEKASIRKASKS